MYIESRIHVAAEPSGPRVLRLRSPTITTPLVGVPEPFLASHYMKVLYPLNDALARGVSAEQ